MKTFKQLVKETNVEPDIPSMAAMTLKEKPNKEPMTKLKEDEGVAASKALQNAHDEARKKRGLPDPDYYLKLRDQKKKEIEDMKKEIEDMKKEEVKEPTGDLKDACWKGYTAVGMKMKNGRKVPNCVPKEEVEIDEGYYKNQEIERQETERLKPPFTPDKPKGPSVVVGKKPEGYSRARQLARQAMQKYKKPVKESLEESRKAEIVKEIVKKKKNETEEKFQDKPILSSEITKA